MHGLRDYHTWWSKLDTKTNILPYLLYVGSEKKKKKKGTNEIMYKTEVEAGI